MANRTEDQPMEAATTAAPTTGAESTSAGADGVSGETAFERQVNEAQADHDANELKGQDADKGKLFELPKIKIDHANPTVLKTTFSGQVEIERGNKQWVEVFNDLAPGKTYDLHVTVFCAGGKKTHRRDAEGNVDAVVQTKSLIITDLHQDDGEDDGS